MAYLIDLGGKGKISKKAAMLIIDGEKRKVQLGRVPAEVGRRICDRLGELEAVRALNGTPRGDLAEWVAGLAEPIRDRLADLGLLPESKKPSLISLASMLDEVFASLQIRPSTRVVYLQTRASLEACLGAETVARSISPLDADRFRRHLVADGLAEATISKRIKTARAFFRLGVRWGMVAANPFEGIKAGSQANRERMAFIPAEDIAKVLEVAPSTEWQALIILARFGGLRCPSEHFELKWGDIDWHARRMIVRSPKTSGKEGREYRVLPLWGEMQAVLERLYLEAPEGAEYVFSTLRRPGVNLRTQFQRLLERAGLKAWPKLFQNLRSSRATELASVMPGHLAAAMMGHTEAVAQKHYLQIRASDFEAALAMPNALEKRDLSRVPTGGDSMRQAEKALASGEAHLPEKQQGAHLVAPCRKPQVTPRGFELPSDSSGKTEQREEKGPQRGTVRGDMEALAEVWPCLSPATRDQILALAGLRPPDHQTAKGAGGTP